MPHKPVYLSICLNLWLKFRLLRLLKRQQNKVNLNVWRLNFFAWFVYKYSKYGGHVKVLTRDFFCDYTDVFVIIFCWVNLACQINFGYSPVASRIKDIGEIQWSMKKYPQIKIWCQLELHSYCSMLFFNLKAKILPEISRFCLNKSIS